jgi:hypothetical protein
MAPIALFAAVVTITTIATPPLGSAPLPAVADRHRSPERHVRSTQPRTEQLLELGSRRSPTFADLRATLEASDVIVYVQTVPDLRPTLDGRLVFLTSTGRHRYLRIDVRNSLTLNDLLSAIAHELQHAVEIAGAVDVRDASSMGSFFERIGVSRSARTRFDTRAAREAGARVKAELLGA